MVDINNLEAWAITQGYDPNKAYHVDPLLPPGYLSPHFKAGEFTCKCCGQLHPNGDMPPRLLLDFLEQIREHFGAPVNINSGYRCPVHNSNVGGATSSRHLSGDAADFWMRDISPKDAYDFADGLIGDAGGVGRYSTFTHIDVRGYKARW